MTTLRYWAALKEAAGRGQDDVQATTLEQALELACAQHGERFEQVLAACSVLVDSDPVGSRDHTAVALRPDSIVDCLPPFAGG